MSTGTSNKWDKFWIDQENTKIIQETDEWVSLVWEEGLKFWQEIIEKYSPGKRMLECGAGSAKVSLHMAKMGYDCTMLDNSEQGLRMGIDSFREANINGKFVIGDVTKLEFPDNSFDVVYSGGLLEHFTNVRPPIQEMIRVLRPGGLFASDIITKHFSCQKVADVMNFTTKFLYRIGTLRFKNSISESRRNFPFYENSIPLKEYEKIIKECGIPNVIAGGTGPFPSIALPKSWRHAYVLLMKKRIPWWREFDHSCSSFSKMWGASWSVYGLRKKEQE